MPAHSSLKLRPTGWDAVVVGCILAAALGLGVYFWNLGQSSEPLTAILTVDGAEQERLVLAELSAPEERVLHAGDYTLHIMLTADSAAVIAADCPTQDCVHTGVIHRGGQSIVCLPAKVTVTLQGGAAEPDEPDIVIG